jgi:hypothetical protein
MPHPQLVSERQGDAAGDGVGEGQPVLGVHEVDEAAPVPHVLRVAQDRRDGAGRAHHHAWAQCYNSFKFRFFPAIF